MLEHAIRSNQIFSLSLNESIPTFSLNCQPMSVLCWFSTHRGIMHALGPQLDESLMWKASLMSPVLHA